MAPTASQIKLRTLRRDRGLTRIQVAKQIGVSPSVLRWAEGMLPGGGGSPRPENMRRIAEFYGLKILDIWPVEDEEVRAVA